MSFSAPFSAPFSVPFSVPFSASFSASFSVFLCWRGFRRRGGMGTTKHRDTADRRNSSTNMPLFHRMEHARGLLRFEGPCSRRRLCRFWTQERAVNLETPPHSRASAGTLRDLPCQLARPTYLETATRFLRPSLPRDRHKYFPLWCLAPPIVCCARCPRPWTTSGVSARARRARASWASRCTTRDPRPRAHASGVRPPAACVRDRHASPSGMRPRHASVSGMRPRARCCLSLSPQRHAWLAALSLRCVAWSSLSLWSRAEARGVSEYAWLANRIVGRFAGRTRSEQLKWGGAIGLGVAGPRVAGS